MKRVLSAFLILSVAAVAAWSSDSLKLNGEELGPITGVELLDDGANPSSGSYTWDFRICTGGCSVLKNEGRGNCLRLDTNTPGAGVLGSSYRVQPNRNAGAITGGSLYTGSQAGFGYENEYIIKSGNGSITENGGSTEMKMTFTTYGGDTISVEYSGPVTKR